MEVITVLWILIIWITTQWLVSLLQRRLKRAPPGPLPWPIVGNIFSLGKNPHISLARLAKTYGPLISLRLGFLTTVVASSPEVARQILLRKDACLSNRFVGDCLYAFQHNEHAVSIMPVGDRWRTLRKILSLQLTSNKSLDAKEEIRKQNSRDLVTYVNECSKSGVAVNIGQLAFDNALNSMSKTFFSVDMADADSSVGREFKQIMWEIMSEAAKMNLSDLFPALKIVDPQGIRRRMEINLKKLFDLFDVIVNKRVADSKAGLPERGDVLDALLKICWEKSEDIELSQIPRLLLETFAGSESVSTTVEWAMAELLRNPSKMRKAKAELEQVIGKGNFVEEADIAKLPYLKAILNETFRLHPPVVFLVPRQADSDVEISGFVVPKGSQVLVNLWAIGRDSTIWKDPHSFEPVRFMDSDIDIKGQHLQLIPFGAGRRMCVGLSLGMKLIHVILASLLHFYEWKLEDGVAPGNLDMDETFGVGLHKAKPLFVYPVNV